MPAEALAQWIMRNSKERFKHTKQIAYTAEEITEKSKKSCQAGVGIMNMEKIMADVKSAVENGIPENGEPFIVEIRPNTAGMKSLKTERRQWDVEVDRGYMELNMDIFGLPDAQTNSMIYVTIEGEEVEDRKRSLSPREKHDFFGIFMAGIAYDKKISNS